MTGSLELVNEFEITGGGAVEPHTHPTHEFYYVRYGRGEMIIGDEKREISHDHPRGRAWRRARVRHHPGRRRQGRRRVAGRSSHGRGLIVDAP